MIVAYDEAGGGTAVDTVTRGASLACGKDSTNKVTGNLHGVIIDDCNDVFYCIIL
jgi:hypothetical protein